MQTKMQSKKTYIIDIVIVLIVTELTIFYMVHYGIFDELDSLKEIPWFGFLTILIITAICILLRSFVFRTSFKNTNTNLGYGSAISAYMFGTLGSGITPFKIGHFPFMFYYYGKRKVQFEQSLGIMCMNQIIYALTTIFTYFTIMILCIIKKTSIVIQGTTLNLWFFAMIGFLFNLGTLILVLLMTYSKAFHKAIVKCLSFFLFKFKKISSREAYEEEHALKMKIYKEQVNFVIKHLHKFLLTFLCFFIYIILYYTVPYIIYLFMTKSAFTLSDFLFFFSLSQAMTYITNVIPVPGGTGVAEFSFLAIFGIVFPENMVGSAMIVWRVATHYIPLVISFIIFIATMIIYKKRDTASLEKATIVSDDGNNSLKNN